MQVNREFLKAGHAPTLFSAFLYFDVSFMVWVILGPLAVAISKDLGLSPAQKGLMVAIPSLSGAILRAVNGVLVDRLGLQRTGLIGQTIVITGLLLAWYIGVHSFEATLALGGLLGVAGASFAVALPLASRWYPAKYQGAALGIAGAGNSGTVFAALFAPSLAVAVGWNNVLGLACIPLVIVMGVFTLLAKDAPNAPPPKPFADYVKLLGVGDAWWFMFFYAVTFGGFVGLAGSLSIYFNSQYGLSSVEAGYCTSACVFAGSLVRPLGGALADRIGGIKTLSTVYIVAALAFATVSIELPTFPMALAVFVVGMLALGAGNGAVFQLVPQRFRDEIGPMTGLIGMTGGLGGFYLASSLGLSKQLTGSFQDGFLIFAGLAVLAVIGLTAIKRHWRTTWGAVAGASAVRI